MLVFYVYAYLRKDGTPYYIGKGKGDRAYSKQHTISPPKNKSQIVFIEQHLTDVGSLAIERKMIRWYGRKDLGTGILRNKTDGGDGTSGYIWSLEAKNKMSLERKGKTHTTETKKKMSSVALLRAPVNEETKVKLRECRKLQIFSEETKSKMSKSKSGGKRSEETKAKMCISRNARPPASQETKDKISAFRKTAGGTTTGMKVWNNGHENKMCKEKPEGEWVLGRIKHFL